MYDISFNITRYYKDVYVNSFFPRTYRFWNSLPAEGFPLTHDVNGFSLELIVRSTLGSFYSAFLSISISCNSMPRGGCSALHEVKPKFFEFFLIFSLKNISYSGAFLCAP